MPTTVVEQSFWSRNRWALPVLLALLVAVIVLGAIFGPKLVKSANATATPAVTTQVVTATPASGTPGATVGAGASTPLPGATPVPTVAGLTLGMITTPAHIVTQVQSGADSGTGPYVYHLDPRKVVETDLPHYGFKPPVQIVSPAQANPTPTPYTGVDGRPIINFTVQYQGKNYKVSLAQPATRGPKGVWFIVTIAPA